MAKNKYKTGYLAILKKKAKAAGVKVKKADYRFLDHFMMIQEEAEYPDVKLDLLKESEEVALYFTTYQRAEIYMKMAAHAAGEIEFKSNVIRIPAAQADAVGKQILAGEFINNYLALQLTVQPVNNDFAEIVMDGILWMDCHKKTAPAECSFYLLCFIEQIKQIYHELANESCRQLHIRLLWINRLVNINCLIIVLLSVPVIAQQIALWHFECLKHWRTD